MSEVILDKDHTYWRMPERVRVPGVTEILQAGGYIDDWWFTDEAKLRGTNVHTACEYYDEDDLEWDSVLPEYVSYVKAYTRFRKDTGFKPIEIESTSYSERYNYAGTLDRIGELGGYLALVDIKTGAKAAFWPLQLAAYQRLRRLDYPDLVRYSLRLKDNGKYDLSPPYTDPMDWDAFAACLYVYFDKKKRGLIK